MHAVHMARAKTATALSDPRRALILKLVEERGPITQAQMVKALNMSWGQVQWHLYILEREGKIRRVTKNSLTYYVSATAPIDFSSDLE
ncbi:MAG: ArsR family transcriptional regulator [Pyrobaculum sp. JCHS_4]|nr:MAG: ArsR family transcriptional regulator [Pyrobaculum sp. JCHS_4]